jgi:hypothetical protein
MKQPTVSLDDLISDKDKAKHQLRINKEIELQDSFITEEWLDIAEFGFYFGWQAVNDVMNDKITIDVMKMLLIGAKKVHSRHVLDMSLAVRSSHATSVEAYNDIMKSYIKDVKEVA